MATNSSVMAAAGRWVPTWNATFYTSAINLAATGDTGIIATPLMPAAGRPALLPLFFLAAGNNMATDETNTLTIAWYANAAGDGGAIGTTAFAQMTAGAPIPPLEIWPGDVSAYGPSRDLVPLFPYCKITWTLAGTTKSMGFTLWMSYLELKAV